MIVAALQAIQSPPGFQGVESDILLHMGPCDPARLPYQKMNIYCSRLGVITLAVAN